MNWYATKKMAEQRHEELLREAEQERLARQSRGGRPGTPLELKLAFAMIAVLVALAVAGPMLNAAA
jgi:hypothetical protein